MAVMDEALIRRVYAAFNARDIDAVLERLDPDVDWPNAWEGGRVRGHEAVRDYWTRQWREIDGRVEPQGMSRRGDERLAVDVHQVVHALDGTLLADVQVVHVYTIRDGLITRMDVEEAAPG
jgi:ketosteroid isomerase-like protein